MQSRVGAIAATPAHASPCHTAASATIIPQAGSAQSFAINAFGASEALSLEKRIPALHPGGQAFDHGLALEAVPGGSAGQTTRHAVPSRGASAQSTTGSIRYPRIAAETGTDMWGPHITAATRTMGQLITIASASAGAVVPVLNMRGFPLGMGGAPSGVIVAALHFASAGILLPRTVGGLAAQSTYTGVTRTC